MIDTFIALAWSVGLAVMIAVTIADIRISKRHSKTINEYNALLEEQNKALWESNATLLKSGRELSDMNKQLCDLITDICRKGEKK